MTSTSADDVRSRGWRTVTWAVVDVEGNGQPEPDLVEVAVVTVQDGVVGPARSWLIRPPRPVTWRARQIHGLSTRDLDDAPTLDQVAPEILRSLDGVDVLAGHQVGVDLAVLARSIGGWPDLPAVDTLRLARALHPDLPSHRLGTLADGFGLADGLPGPAHRAVHDATVTARLLVRLAAALPDPTVGDLQDVGRAPRQRASERANEAAATLFEVP